jgi:hypothetical protein
MTDRKQDERAEWVTPDVTQMAAGSAEDASTDMSDGALVS